MLAGISAREVRVPLDTCSAGRFNLVKSLKIDDKTWIGRFQRVSGRSLIAAAADEKMVLEGKGQHGVFTFTLLAAISEAVEMNKDAMVSVTEIAEYIDQQVPAITKRKWWFEHFPMMETRGSVFRVARRQ